MAIDHPDLLLDLLCSKNEYRGRADFRKQLSDLHGINLKQKSKTDQMYLNMLTALNLLENKKSQNISIYKKTLIANQICKERKNPNKEIYRKTLQSVLLESEYTKPFFNKLIEILNKGMKNHLPINSNDLVWMKVFSNETLRTLKALGKEAGLIEERDGCLIVIKSELKSLDFKKFKEEVFHVYNSIIEQQRNQGVYTRTTHARISEVRKNVCILNRISLAEFDEQFKKLLSSPEGRKIEIFGAAPQYLPDKKDPNFENFIFMHNRKIYVFMTI